MRRSLMLGMLPLLLAGCEEWHYLGHNEDRGYIGNYNGSGGDRQRQEDAFDPYSHQTYHDLGGPPLHTDAGMPSADAGKPPSPDAGGPALDQGGPVCVTQLKGDELCLICSQLGVETYRQCVPAELTCKTISSTADICLVCTTSSGQQMSKQCLPLQQTCASQVVKGQLCLVCTDTKGKILKTLCPTS